MIDANAVQHLPYPSVFDGGPQPFFSGNIVIDAFFCFILLAAVIIVFIIFADIFMGIKF